MDTRLIILDLETCRGQGDILAPSRVIAFVLKMGMGPVRLFTENENSYYSYICAARDLSVRPPHEADVLLPVLDPL